MQTVNWNNPALEKAPRKDRPNRRETKYRVVCDACGFERKLARTDAEHAEAHNACSRCQKRNAGRVGFAASLARMSRAYLLSKIAESQLERPSAPERRVAEWLTEAGVEFVRQVPFETPTRGAVLDFVVLTGNGLLVLEVNGYWHQQRGAARDAWLEEALDFPVVFMDADVMSRDLVLAVVS